MKRKILLVLFIILLALCVTNISKAAVGDKIEKGDFVYTVIDEEAKAVEVSNKHISVIDKNKSENNKVDYENLITTTQEVLASPVIINAKEYTVTSIGTATFCDCKTLENIVIPNTITNIGEYAFYWAGPRSWDIKSSNCITLKIPDSVKTIGNNAFEFCSMLKSVEIPDTVTKLGEYAFSMCENLETANIPKGITTIEAGTFGSTNIKSIVIPEGVTVIGGGAFALSNIQSITIPNSVKTIGETAFWGCSFKTINIPDSVTTIENDAFDSCTNLESITIPKSVTSIGTAPFAYCENLKEVKILNKEIKIGKGLLDRAPENVILYSYEGSTAESYAKENSVPFVYLDHNTKYGCVTMVASADNSLAGIEIAKNNNVYKEMAKILAGKGYNKVYCAYDLTATSKIENGVELTFNVGTANNGKEVMVLHRKSDGKDEEFKKTVENGLVKITVTEFSPFILAIKEKENGTVTEAGTGNKGTTGSEGVTEEKDNTPPTGVSTIYVTTATLLAIVSAGAIVILRKVK